MKSQVICDALNTVNPTSSQIARMRAALEAQLPAEKPHRRGAHQQKASSQRWWTIIPAAAALFAVVLLKVFLTPGLPCGHTLFAAGAGCFLLCTCIELPQTLFEAFNGMLTMPDLLTGLAMGVFGLCGLACTWAAAGEETE